MEIGVIGDHQCRSDGTPLHVFWAVGCVIRHHSLVVSVVSRVPCLCIVRSLWRVSWMCISHFFRMASCVRSSDCARRALVMRCCWSILGATSSFSSGYLCSTRRSSCILGVRERRSLSCHGSSCSSPCRGTRGPFCVCSSSRRLACLG